MRPVLLSLLAVSCSASPLATRDARLASDDQVATLQAGDHTLRLPWGGLDRSYHVHVPSRAASPAPVLLAFHGGGSNARQFERYAGLDALSDREGFLVIYPEGTARGNGDMRTWNAGLCCGWAALSRVDDVGFTRALVDDLARRAVIDRARVYATGHSNGAMMSYRLAVEAPDLVAAIAPVAGSLVYFGATPAQAVPVLDIHSVDDPRALYNGGLGPPFPGTTYRSQHTSVPVTLAAWAKADGCPADPHMIDSKTWESHTATLLEWGPCASGAVVRHWKLTVAGHGWPGASGPALERILGPRTNVINAAEEVWGFVSRFRR